MSQFSDLWTQLSRPKTGEFIMGEVANTAKNLPIRLAIDKEGFHHVLIPSEGFINLDFTDSSSLKVTTKSLGISGGKFQSVLDVYCINSSLAKTFDRLAAELVDVARHGHDPVESALSCLNDWKSLFSARGRRTISPQQRIGLFAELSVLLEFIHAGEVADTRCWTGPAKAPHDFEFDSISLEVKAYGSGSEQVTFHGALQLDSSDGKPLFLCLRQIEEASDGNSLLELAAEIEECVDDSQRFRRTLNKLGVHDDDRSLQDYKYQVVKETLVEVTEKTPRIVASSFVDGGLPTGVEMLRYSVHAEDLIGSVAYADFRTWLKEVRE